MSADRSSRSSGRVPETVPEALHSLILSIFRSDGRNPRLVCSVCAPPRVLYFYEVLYGKSALSSVKRYMNCGYALHKLYEVCAALHTGVSWDGATHGSKTACRVGGKAF